MPKPLQRVLLGFLGLHLALFAFDLSDPAAFLRGDRAGARLELLIRAMNPDGEGLRHLFLATGLPGDYLVFAPFLALGGQYAVIVAQIFAATLTLLATYGIARALGATVVVAAGGAALFALLPGSVMDPHLLVTETFFTALFAGAVWALSEAAAFGRRDRMWLGMILMTLAACIRPQAMPFILVAAVPLCLLRPGFGRSTAAAAVIALIVFPGSWLLWRYLQVGEIGLGPSMFDLGINLKTRADRVALVAEIPGWVPFDQDHPSRMSFGEFADLSRVHPMPTVKTFVSDFINLVANPGANGVFGAYLQFYEPFADSFYWKHLMDSEGMFGVLREGFTRNGRLAFSLALTGAIHGLTLLGAAVGVWSVLRDRLRRPPGLVVVLLFLAQAGVVFASGLVRWPHRAPLEPILAAFAAIGIATILVRHRRGKTAPAEASPLA